MSDETRVPFEERAAANTPGHWLLARLGKRVLRPGGLRLTRRLLAHADIAGRTSSSSRRGSAGPRSTSSPRIRARTRVWNVIRTRCA